MIQLVQERDVGQDSREAAAVTLAQMPSQRGTHSYWNSSAPMIPAFWTRASQDRGVDVVSDQSLNRQSQHGGNLAEGSLLRIVDLVRKNGVKRLLELLNHTVPLTRSPAVRIIVMTHDPRALDP